jgi:hypothetical protein
MSDIPTSAPAESYPLVCHPYVLEKLASFDSRFKDQNAKLDDLLVMMRGKPDHPENGVVLKLDRLIQLKVAEKETHEKECQDARDRKGWLWTAVGILAATELGEWLHWLFHSTPKT